MTRGEIYWADLVPRSGSEQTGRRPVIVVSSDGFNRTPGWMSIIVVPISTSGSQGGRGPTVVELPGASTGLPKNKLRGLPSGNDAGARQIDQEVRYSALRVAAQRRGGAQGCDGSRLIVDQGSL